MRFGKNYSATDDVATESSGTSFIKYFKNPVTTFRVLQDPEGWVTYWEHFNPGSFPFPCTGDRKTCPGCTSEVEKMTKASKKVAINVLEGEYVNVYKFPVTLADKLNNRAERIGTVTDREYTIYKQQSKNADGSVRTDYDLEGGDKEKIDISKYQLHDVDEMLAAAFEKAWGDSGVEVEDKAEEVKAEPQPKEPPFDPKPGDLVGVVVPEKIYSEAELRELSVEDLVVVMKDEGVLLPEGMVSEGSTWTTDQLVDWLIDQQQ